jgi:hypothetical protein
VTRVGALEALGRGLVNVRANAELVPAVTAGTLAVFLLLLASFLPWLGALGLDPRDLVAGEPPDFDALAGAARAGLAPEGIVARFGVAFTAIALGLIVSSLMYCWYWGGALGVLVAGEAQAPPGAGRAPAVFRTFSARFLLGEARRLTAPVLLFLSLFLGLMLLLLVALGALFALALALGERRGGGAGLAVGCGGAFPLLFAWIALLLALWFGQVELPRRGIGVRAAATLGFRWLGARLGAALALFALFLCASLAIGIFVGGAGFLIKLWFAESFPAELTIDLLAWFAQLVSSAALNLVLAASFAALARGERAHAGGTGA